MIRLWGQWCDPAQRGNHKAGFNNLTRNGFKTPSNAQIQRCHAKPLSALILFFIAAPEFF